MIEDSRLKVFLAVAEEGSFTQAARKLGISQPAVSQNIAELEKNLGTELFERSRGSVMLTPAGHSFKEYAGRIVHWYSAVDDLFGEKGKLTSQGTVRIAADSFVAGSILSLLLVKLRAVSPGLGFKVSHGEVKGYDILFRTSPHTEVLALEESSCYAGAFSAAAITSNPSYSGISDIDKLPARVKFAVWEPYSSMLPPDARAKVSLESFSVRLVAEAVAADPQTIGLLPLEAAPSGLTRLPVSLRKLERDLFIVPSEEYRDSDFYNSLRNLAMEARKSDL